MPGTLDRGGIYFALNALLLENLLKLEVCSCVLCFAPIFLHLASRWRTRVGSSVQEREFIDDHVLGPVFYYKTCIMTY